MIQDWEYPQWQAHLQKCVKYCPMCNGDCSRIIVQVEHHAHMVGFYFGHKGTACALRIPVGADFKQRVHDMIIAPTDSGEAWYSPESEWAIFKAEKEKAEAKKSLLYGYIEKPPPLPTFMHPPNKLFEGALGQYSGVVFHEGDAPTKPAIKAPLKKVEVLQPAGTRKIEFAD